MQSPLPHSASSTSRGNNYNNYSSTTTTATAPKVCSVPEQIRFPSYATFSNLKAFLAVTGGDAPWYSPTRTHALQNSKDFFRRFLDNLSSVMARYACDMKNFKEEQNDVALLQEYRNKTDKEKTQKEKTKPKQTDDDDDDDATSTSPPEPPQLPNELRRMCAYVSAYYTGQRLFDHPDTQRELSELLSDPRVRDNKALSRIFTGCPVQAASRPKNNKESHQSSSTVSSAVSVSNATSTTTPQVHGSGAGRVSSAKAALMAAQQQKQATTTPPPPSSSAATATKSINNNNNLNGGSENNNNYYESDNNTDHLAWAEETMKYLIEVLQYFGVEEENCIAAFHKKQSPPPPPPQQQQNMSSVTDVNNKTNNGNDVQKIATALPSASSPSSSSSSIPSLPKKVAAQQQLERYGNLLQLVAQQIEFFISTHETWLNKTFNPNTIAENFWAPKNYYISQFTTFNKNNNINGNNKENDDDDDEENNDDGEENANNNNNNDDDDDDNNYLQKRSQMQQKSKSSPAEMLSKSFEDEAEEKRNKNVPPEILARMTQSRVVLSNKKPGIDIFPSPHQQSESEIENNNNTEGEQQKINVPSSRWSENDFRIHQAVLNAVLASNSRIHEQWIFAPVAAAPSSSSISLYDFAAGIFASSSSSSSTSQEAEIREEKFQQLKAIVSPLEQTLLALGEIDPQTNNLVNTKPSSNKSKKLLFSEAQMTCTTSATSNAFEPNIHSKINNEVVKLQKRIEWNQLQTYLLALTQLITSHYSEMQDACYVFSRFFTIVEKAKLQSGYLFRNLRAYEYDVDHGKACRHVGDKMEEKTLMNKDFIRGAASALMRQKPYLTWLGIEKVTDWLTYCWVRWTSLEDDANKKLFGYWDEEDDEDDEDEENEKGEKASNNKMTNFQRFIQKRNEQRLRFVELALELKKEAQERFGNDGKSKNIPRVWVPVTSAEFFCLDRRDFPNSISCPCISELDVTVVDVSSCFDDADEDVENEEKTAQQTGAGAIASSSLPQLPSTTPTTNNNKKTTPTTSLPSLTFKNKLLRPVKVELVLEIKYSPCDLIKASNQEVVFARGLATTVKTPNDLYRGFIRIKPGVSPETSDTEKFDTRFSDMWSEVGHVAFGSDTLPDLMQIRNVINSAPSGGAAASRRNNNHNSQANKNANDELLKNIKIPMKYSEFLLSQEQKNNASNQGLSFPQGFALTIESFSNWARDEANTRFRAVSPTKDASIPRFFLVSTWPAEDASESRYFPVYAPLKHFVVRNVASLLAKGGWKGVSDDESVNQMLTQDANAFEALNSPGAAVVMKEEQQQQNAEMASAAPNDENNSGCHQRLPSISPSSPASDIYCTFFYYNSQQNNNNNTDNQRRMIASSKSLERCLRVALHPQLFVPKQKTKKLERDYKYRIMSSQLKRRTAQIDEDIPCAMNGDQVARKVSFQDFVASVSYVSSQWQKLKKQKNFLSPQEVYDKQYFENDNILFVRFEKF